MHENGCLPGDLQNSQSQLLIEGYFLEASFSMESLSGVGTLGSQIAAVLN